MKTLVIEIHSLNRFQITRQDTPFLYKLTKKYGLGKVRPCFAYDIQTCFWTGTYPEKNNHFAKYEYHKNYDKFHLIDLLPNKLRNVFYNVGKYLKGDDFFTNLCSNKYTHHFKIARRFHFFHKKVFEVPTLFDVLRKNNKKFLYYQWPTIATNNNWKLRIFPKLNDIKVSKKFIKLVKKNNNLDFYFLQLRDLDIVAHKYGPYSKESKRKLKDIDNSLKSILNNFSIEKDNMFIFSYFGMVPVKGKINLKKVLPQFGKGYYYFLDSTEARFWFFNSKIKKQVINILKKIKQGHLLTEKEKINYHINFRDNRHFEELFLLKPGYIISPDFFHKKPIRGAHSYGLKCEEEKGIFLINKKSKKEAELVDMMPSILKLMDISSKNLDRKSILN